MSGFDGNVVDVWIKYKKQYKLMVVQRFVQQCQTNSVRHMHILCLFCCLLSRFVLLCDISVYSFSRLFHRTANHSMNKRSTRMCLHITSMHEPVLCLACSTRLFHIPFGYVVWIDSNLSAIPAMRGEHCRQENNVVTIRCDGIYTRFIVFLQSPCESLDGNRLVPFIWVCRLSSNSLLLLWSLPLDYGFATSALHSDGWNIVGSASLN